MRIPAALITPSRAPQRDRALPHFTGGRRPVGETRTTRRSVMPVVGSPSMRVIRDEDGGAKTLLRRSMIYADFLSDDDLAGLRRMIGNVADTAQTLSQGGLTKRDLRRRRHPYGKGRRKGLGRLRGSGNGVSNMAIANKHSGDYANAWEGEILRDKSGVTLVLGNDVSYAAYLAFGTKRMRAHGPQTTAMAKHLSAIDAEWRRLARVAKSRAEALGQVQYGVSQLMRAG